MDREPEIDAPSAEALSRWENDGGALGRDVGFVNDMLPRVSSDRNVSTSHGIGPVTPFAKPQDTHKLP